MAGRGVGAAVKAHENISIPRVTPVFVAARPALGGTLNDTTSPTLTFTLPVGYQTGDLLTIFIESEGADAAPTAPTGFTLLATSTDVTAPVTRLTTFWKIGVAGEASPIVGGGISHMIGGIAAFRGTHPITPIEAFNAAGIDTNLTAITVAGVTTLGDNRIVVAVATDDTDVSSTSYFSAWANAGLTGVTEILDGMSSLGSGGGLGAAFGIKTTAGASGSFTATSTTGTNRAQVSFAIKGFP